MGFKNLKQRSVSFAKDIPKNVRAKLRNFKGSAVSFIERIVGRPITAATKKRAVMRITVRPEYIRQVVHKAVIEIAEPEVVTEAAVREAPVFVNIADSVPCSTSIRVPSVNNIAVQTTLAEFGSVQDDLFDDRFETIRVCNIGMFAATSSAAVSNTSAAPYIKDFDEWDFDYESTTAVSEAPAEIPAEPVIVEESEEEKAFFEDLYDSIIARCLYDDVLPAVIPWFYEETELFGRLYDELAEDSVIEMLPGFVPELFEQDESVTSESIVPDYIISEIESFEPEETQITIDVPEEKVSAQLEKFINGAVTFSFGYSGSSEPAGPTKFSFVMGTSNDDAIEEEYEENVHSNIGVESVMAASNQNSRIYL